MGQMPPPGLGDAWSTGRAPAEQDQAAEARSPFLLIQNTDVWLRYARLATRRSYAKGATIYLQGDSSIRFFHLLSGRVRIYNARPDGSQLLLSIAEPGAMFGESSSFAGLPYYASAMAIVPSTVNAFPASALYEVMASDPEGRIDIIRAIVGKQRQLGMQLAVKDHKASVRVARLLTHMMETYGEAEADGAVRLKVRLSIEEMSNLIGVTRVTMSREISVLVKSGILEKDKWEIIVRRPKALRLEAG